MSSFETVTRDGFQALEATQSRLAMDRLDAMLDRLQDLDESLTLFLAARPPQKAERKTSIPAR